MQNYPSISAARKFTHIDAQERCVCTSINLNRSRKEETQSIKIAWVRRVEKIMQRKLKDIFSATSQSEEWSRTLPAYQQQRGSCQCSISYMIHWNKSSKLSSILWRLQLTNILELTSAQDSARKFTHIDAQERCVCTAINLNRSRKEEARYKKIRSAREAAVSR